MLSVDRDFQSVSVTLKDPTGTKWKLKKQKGTSVTEMNS